MKVFLIILAVIVFLIAVILSLSAEATIIYDNGWHTSVQILFIKKDVELSKILNFVLFPEKAGKEAAEKKKQKKEQKPDNTQKQPDNTDIVQETQENTDEIKADATNPAVNSEAQPQQPPKKNIIQKIIDEDGIVGIMLLVSNLLETVNTAVVTLFRGLHIYSLYVKMIIGGGDADEIARSYGNICGMYYPIKGIILNGMKVDQYDDYIQPDFLATHNEYEFQLIASLNVALILKVGLKAGKTFLINLIKNR
ncbi:hypothetical protein [uncultured Eubacterium sp.]|uniref:hypothetical protein n=1 Tax=uncultured Eubacterium sp. TaxID=165185 RepID=UPI0025F73341|nr:hypothetical protein [uncultured Eubacterium sp.]